MKKVLFTATGTSFIQIFLIPYLKYFKEKGYEVHVATNGDDKIPYCDKQYKIPFERNPFKVNNIKSLKQLKKIINQNKYDIIHTHTPVGSVVTRIASIKARKQGTRVIYTAHGFHFYRGAPIRYWLLYYPIEKILAKYTDDLITINKEDYNRAKRNLKTKAHYIEGVGINPNKFNKTNRNLKKSLGLKEDDFIMIFPAELNRNKNQIYLIKAMEQLIKKYDNIHLLLAGCDMYNGYYQKVVNKKNLNNNIHFLGFRYDIPELLKISNLSVSSSLREGLPVNIIEAMYCNLPIIAINCRGMSDLIENNKNGFLIEKNNINEFVSKVEEIYLKKVNLNNNVNKKKLKKLLLDSVKEKYINIYENKV